MKAAITDSLQCIDLIDQKLDRNETLSYFQDLSDHHDSELKFYESDIKNYIASFHWNGINQWKIDCPVELHKVHRQRYATTEECISLIKKLYKSGDLDNEDNFIDVPIRHFTLDEMLQFKKEDEMMLRVQDPDEHSKTSTPKAIEPKKEVSSKTIEKPVPKKATPSPAPPKPKTITSTSTTVKKPKPSNGDNSFFSI